MTELARHAYAFVIARSRTQISSYCWAVTSVPVPVWPLLHV